MHIYFSYKNYVVMDKNVAVSNITSLLEAIILYTEIQIKATKIKVIENILGGKQKYKLH